jgi:hypothetical protein
MSDRHANCCDICHGFCISARGHHLRIAGSNCASASARTRSVRRRDRVPFLILDGRTVARCVGPPAGRGRRRTRSPFSSPCERFASARRPEFNRRSYATAPRSALNPSSLPAAFVHSRTRAAPISTLEFFLCEKACLIFRGLNIIACSTILLSIRPGSYE